MTNKQKLKALGKNVAAALRETYAGGLVSADIVFKKGSYLDGVCAPLRARLAEIDGTEVLWERPPQGGPQWKKGRDPDTNPPDWHEEPSSYHLFFVALQGEEYEYEGELPELQDVEGGVEPIEVSVSTVGRIGCIAAVSRVAPFAVVRLRDMEFTANGWNTDPDLGCTIFNLDGSAMDMDEYFGEMFEDEGVKALHRLRDKIAKVLGAFDIEVLSDEELSKGVSGLRAEPEIVVGAQNGELTVEKALFFRCRSPE